MLFDNVPFSELAVFDKAATIAIYLTLGLIIAATAVLYAVKRKKPESYGQFKSITVGTAIGYSIGLSAMLLVMKLSEYQTDGSIDKTSFIPICILLCLFLAVSVALLVVSIFKPDKFNTFTKITENVAAAAFGVFIIMRMFAYYKTAKVTPSSEIQLYVYTTLLTVAIIVLALIFGKKSGFNSTKSIVYAAVCIAMSFALSYLRLFELPQGGSITLASLLPLMIYSYMFGVRKGVLVGVVYGFLQFIQAPWFYHPIQFLLDYPLAFGAIGLAAMYKEKNIFADKKVLQFALGAVTVAVIRYFSHVISGIFVFGSGDPENYSAVAWSFLYNSFVFADMAIAIVAGCGAFANKSFLRLLEKTAENPERNEKNEI